MLKLSHYSKEINRCSTIQESRCLCAEAPCILFTQWRDWYVEDDTVMIAPALIPGHMCSIEMSECRIAGVDFGNGDGVLSNHVGAVNTS